MKKLSFSPESYGKSRESLVEEKQTDDLRFQSLVHFDKFLTVFMSFNITFLFLFEMNAQLGL